MAENIKQAMLNMSSFADEARSEEEREDCSEGGVEIASSFANNESKVI